MQNSLKKILFSSILLSCVPASAESTADQLTRIEAETMLLKARERQLEVQAKILAREEEIAARKTGNYPSVAPSSADNPVVHSIEGLGTRMFATLQLHGGALIDVQVGDTLDNGMKVQSIRPNEVIIQTRQKRSVRLGLMPVAPASFDAAPASPAVKLPPPPPMLNARNVR